jgi:hypothetical protein
MRFIVLSSRSQRIQESQALTALLRSIPVSSAQPFGAVDPRHDTHGVKPSRKLARRAGGNLALRRSSLQHPAAARQLRSAGGEDQGRQAEDESKRRHHHRPEAQPRAFRRGLE